MKVVTVYLTRHAESTAHRNGVNPQPNLKGEMTFINAGLSSVGYEQIIKTRQSKLEKIGTADYIFCSPLKRAMQTCLLTYNETNVNCPIYLMSLLTEFDKTPECEGVPVISILKDPELMTYKNSALINLDYFWLYNDNNKVTGEWYNNTFRWDLYNRISKFFEFMKLDKFTGKVIHVYSHAGFIGNVNNIKRGINNYQTVKVVYNQETANYAIEFID